MGILQAPVLEKYIDGNDRPECKNRYQCDRLVGERGREVLEFVKRIWEKRA